MLAIIRALGLEEPLLRIVRAITRIIERKDGNSDAPL